MFIVVPYLRKIAHYQKEASKKLDLVDIITFEFFFLTRPNYEILPVMLIKNSLTYSGIYY